MSLSNREVFCTDRNCGSGEGYKGCHSITKKCPVQTGTMVVANKEYQGCHSITEKCPVQTGTVVVVSNVRGAIL